MDPSNPCGHHESGATKIKKERKVLPKWYKKRLMKKSKDQTQTRLCEESILQELPDFRDDDLITPNEYKWYYFENHDNST